jgi:hypothetical protein
VRDTHRKPSFENTRLFVPCRYGGMNSPPQFSGSCTLLFGPIDAERRPLSLVTIIIVAPRWRSRHSSL